MEVAKIFISENKATVQKLKMITSGTVGAKVSFVFDETWDGFVKTYVFRAGSKTKDDTDATGIIPAELIAKPGQLEVGVYGTKGDIVLPTIWANLGTICAGADPSGDPSTNPHLPVWAQLKEDVEDLKDMMGVDGVKDIVLFSAQNPTEAQQAQARANIAAVSAAEVEAIVNAKFSNITNAEEVAY